MIAFLRSLVTLLAALLMLLINGSATACSMYKVTVNGKTIVGCNHDTWIATPRIWFETRGYGACFAGARFDGSYGFAPQSGMNVHGLAFSRLVAPPTKGIVTAEKKVIKSQTQFLKDVLHSCKTVAEAKVYIDRFDHSIFSNDVLIYIDRSGKYLIVEPYSTTIDAVNKYVLANFCPSQVDDLSSIKQERYVNGMTFRKNKIATDIEFCRALSDTMHVCREKIGDGTLLTSIWNLNDGLMHLYFYHDYQHQRTFDIKKELARGDHILEVPKLFPPNAEFKQLEAFKTPLNSSAVDFFLKFSMVYFLISSLYFLIGFLRKRKSEQYSYVKLGLFILNVAMMYYMFALATEIGIYYFPAPYEDYKFSLLSVAAYLPFVLLLLIGPLVVMNVRLFREKVWNFLTKLLFAFNNFIYFILIIFFFYWGLYDVFH